VHVTVAKKTHRKPRRQQGDSHATTASKQITTFHGDRSIKLKAPSSPGNYNIAHYNIAIATAI